MAAFIGRENELSLLRSVLEKPSAAVMVYGKRKVGKTTLLAQALKESADLTVYYECLKSTMQDNIDAFVAVLVKLKVLPVQLNFSSFAYVFAYLNTLGNTYNVVIDEYPYLKEMTRPETVDSLFQTVIDNHIGNIRLFISGSHIGMMKDMLNEKNALYGRFTLTIGLKELNYIEAADFYPEKPVYDKIAFYSVFGGSPFVNAFIDQSKDIKANVVATILNPYCPVFTYAEHLLFSAFVNSVNAERIMYAIANGRKRYAEIEDKLGMKSNGLLSKQLAALMDMEIVTKRFPINKPDDRKKTTYELSDNLLRFYYAFVYKNKGALTVLGADAFYDEYIEKTLVTFISHRLEEQCRSFFSLQVKTGAMRGISDIGTYWYDDSKSRTNGEFDVVLKRGGKYDIYEVKYYASPVTEKDILTEAGRIKNIKGLTTGRIGFIAASGFEKDVNGFDLISGKQLYDRSNG
ncbi:MAG: AAA family ATPase [Clostridia bacterium]|nr:AAA family ATPase [Clostridia bacterium]